MYSVLFVDDQPQVLTAIERLLRRKQPDWHCTFATSGAEGLKAIEAADTGNQNIDVVVADMRMPEMDGPTFLSNVRETHPEMIRIVLSGVADLEANLRVIPVAHQFLKKPLEVERLEEAVIRSCQLRNLLKNNNLTRIVGQIDSLPIQPGIYHELTEALANPMTSMQSVGELIEKDPGMSAKVLQMVNSAFFGTTISAANIQQAVTFLGLPQIRQLLLVLEVFEVFESWSTRT
jgi:DNA-binding NtrC family response regulator